MSLKRLEMPFHAVKLQWAGHGMGAFAFTPKSYVSPGCASLCRAPIPHHPLAYSVGVGVNQRDYSAVGAGVNSAITVPTCNTEKPLQGVLQPRRNRGWMPLKTLLKCR